MKYPKSYPKKFGWHHSLSKPKKQVLAEMAEKKAHAKELNEQLNATFLKLFNDTPGNTKGTQYTGPKFYPDFSSKPKSENFKSAKWKEGKVVIDVEADFYPGSMPWINSPYITSSIKPMAKQPTIKPKKAKAKVEYLF